MTHVRNLATLTGVKVSVIAGVNLATAQVERASNDILGAIIAKDVDAVVTDKQPIVTGRDARQALLIALAVKQSYLEKRQLRFSHR